MLTSDDSLEAFMVQAKRINECLHAYGIHSATLQPELVSEAELEGRRSLGEKKEGKGREVLVGGGEEMAGAVGPDVVSTGLARSASGSDVRQRIVNLAKCRIACGTVCEGFACCSK